MNERLFTVSSDENEVVPWSIKVDGYFKKKSEEQMLNDEMPQEAIDSIFANGARILSHCPNPDEDKEVSETGIVIGKVQSGKTSNFISTLALAFDNDYDIAIVLGGNTLDLLKQNAKRIQASFKVDPERLTVLKTNDNKSLINSERIKEFIECDRKIIIVGLKHYKHISLIADIFDNEYLAEKPVLIIDDEGDQATLNTKAYIDSLSSTYEANILIKSFDMLSPDFGELVYAGEGYCGLQEFHGENSDKRVYEIPESEGNLLDNTGVPKSVYKAMAMFFVGNAIRRSRGDTGDHAMLIHPSQKKYDHQIVVNKIQGILDDWRNKAKTKLSGVEDISYITLRRRLLDGYNSFIADGVNCVPFEELENTILDIIKRSSPVHICNSDKNAVDDAAMYKTNIFVGGNLVERGITIKGLAVTYITRRAKGKSNVDNTEQRARWFGYKAKYIDVCRVFTTKDIKDDFANILEHDEDMWASIERARERGVPFKDIPRIFTLASSVLQLTRKNVAKTSQYALSEWKPQKYYIPDEPEALENCRIIADFRKKYDNQLVKQQHNATQIHMVLPNLSFSTIYNELLSKLSYLSDEIVDSEFFGLFKEALEKAELNPPVDIYWIRDTVHQERKIMDDWSIQQLFQGRNPNTSSPTYYEGDRSLSDENPDHIQIQIHYVKPSNLTSVTHYSPVLALYVPQICNEEFSKMVVRS